MKEIISLLGSIGIFLYGMQQLSRALEAICPVSRIPRSSRNRRLDSRSFSFCCLRGAAVTAVLQSSGAVTLFALSAARSGLLAVSDAVALCWGANLGTTVTGYLIAFSHAGGGLSRLLPAVVCPLACFAGVLLYALPRPRAAGCGQALLGFGLLFTGLDGMQAALLPRLGRAEMLPLFSAGSVSPALAFGVGLFLSAALQSSSAALGLLQTFAAGQSLPWRTALPFLLGCNVGTCSTVLLAAMLPGHGRRAARQVAAGHLFFNAAACAFFSPAALLPHAAVWGQQSASSLGIAAAQTLVNAVTLFLLSVLLFLLKQTHVRNRLTRVSLPAVFKDT